MRANSTNKCDVVILGTGLAGTMLGAILAKNGVDTVLIDAKSHPRFAVGESTIPYTSMMMRIVGERFGVPEIKQLASFESVRSNVSTSCGIKRNFGFVYHREGLPQAADEFNQFAIPRMLHTENHFFRQAIDAHMLHTAVKYGARLMQRRVETVAPEDDGIALETDKGETVRAQYLVDCSGHASPVAQLFGLRESPTRLKHQSRAIFTHMIGVRPYDDVDGGRIKKPSLWHQGTLHHLFDGGWMWVIPFDNHSRATNPLCSVGLNLDPRRHPKPESTPEKEFRRFLARFPSIASQFESAKVVRPWVSTERLQYSSKTILGPRYCLTSHAAGFVDALFSRGLTNTLEVINALAPRLLAAVKENDYATERFEMVEKLEQGLLDFNDDLIYCAYTSFRDFNLWNATFRVWALGAVLSTFVLQRAYSSYLDSRDESIFIELEQANQSGFVFKDDIGFDRLLSATVALCQQVEAGTLDAAKAGDQIFDLIEEADFVPPAFGFHDPKELIYHPTLGKVAATMRWSLSEAPEQVGKLVREGLSGFVRKRWSPKEPSFKAELRALFEGPGKPVLLRSPREKSASAVRLEPYDSRKSV